MDIFIESILFTLFIATCSSVELPECLEHKLPQCQGKHQICDANSHRCLCDIGFDFNPNSLTVEDACEVPLPPTDDSHLPHPGHPMVMAIFIILTFILITSAIVLVVRRYHLVHWLRQKMVSRRDSGVMYEDVMIGQDDPPITA